MHAHAHTLTGSALLTLTHVRVSGQVRDLAVYMANVIAACVCNHIACSAHYGIFCAICLFSRCAAYVECVQRIAGLRPYLLTVHAAADAA